VSQEDIMGREETSEAMVEIGNQAIDTQETAAFAQAEQAKAMVQARYLVAIKRPRDLDVVRQKLLKDCKRTRFAEEAVYHKPVGDGVRGPSIRFAEAAMRAMGNMSADCLTLYEDEEKKRKRVEVIDYESNTCWGREFTLRKTVERKQIKGKKVYGKRPNSRGQIVYEVEATEDEVFTKESAWESKHARTGILRQLPADILDECMEWCERTTANSHKEDPDRARKKLFDAFGGIGVTVEELKAYIGHDPAQISDEEHAHLQALYLAIRDGEANWKAAVEARQAERDGAEDGEATPQRAQKKPESLDDVKNKARQKRTSKASGASKKKPEAPPDANVQEKVAALVDRIKQISNKFECQSWMKKHKAEIDALPTGAASAVYEAWNLVREATEEK